MSAKHDYRISFDHEGESVVYEYSDVGLPEALTEARIQFQWDHGTWPGVAGVEQTSI